MNSREAKRAGYRRAAELLLLEADQLEEQLRAGAVRPAQVADHQRLASSYAELGEQLARVGLREDAPRRTPPVDPNQLQLQDDGELRPAGATGAPS